MEKSDANSGFPARDANRLKRYKFGFSSRNVYRKLNVYENSINQLFTFLSYCYIMWVNEAHCSIAIYTRKEKIVTENNSECRMVDIWRSGRTLLMMNKLCRNPTGLV